MLDQLRKGSGSWLAKILLGLLILSFGVWGIGDIFNRGGGNSSVATVGDTEISVADFGQAYSVDLRRLQQRIGRPIDAAFARQAGLPQRTLQRMLAETLFTLAADKYGLVVSDEAVRRVVAEVPAFQTNGRYDYAQLKAVLRRNRIDEATYIASVRGDIVRNELAQTLQAGRVAPAGLVDPIFNRREQTRVAEMFVISAASFRDVGVPDEASLRAYHEENAGRYTAPEYREVTFLTLTPDLVVDRIEVSEEELEDEYNSRLAEFSRTERRRVEQLLYADESAARAARSRVVGGEALTRVAAATSPLNAGSLSLGDLEQGDLPDELDQVVFSLSEGEVSEPVASEIGWHVFRVTNVAPAGVTGLDELRDALRESLARTHAADALYDLSNQLEDELAEGSDLESAALRLALEVQLINAIDENGLNRAGTPVAGLPPQSDFVNSVFAADVGLESSPQETDDGGYYMIRVDSVTPSAVRPLEEIRRQVIEDWQEEERFRRAEQAAQEAVQSLENGRGISTVARQHGASVRKTDPLSRTSGLADPAVSAHLVSAMFGSAEGGYVSAPLPGGDGYVVARLDSIIRASPATNGVAMAQLRDSLAGALLEDALLQYQVALQDEFGVEVNQSLFDTLLLNDSFVAGGSGGGLPAGGGLPPHQRM